MCLSVPKSIRAHRPAVLILKETIAAGFLPVIASQSGKCIILMTTERKVPYRPTIDLQGKSKRKVMHS